MSSKNFDVIVVGAGSMGVPVAMELAGSGLRVLVLEGNPSPGQGQNKSAIGGVRATHSDPGKIEVCLQSLKILSRWKEEHGDDIAWQTGGYCFPVYHEEHEAQLKNLLEVQKAHGLNIDWISADDIGELIPGVNREGLRGGTYSPEDGNLSSLYTIMAFYRKALENGAKFAFNETMTGLKMEKGRVAGIVTDKGEYGAETVVLATGAETREIGYKLGLEIPVAPDTHEAGVTEPVKNFFSAMLVDLRLRPGTGNFYFYQNPEGKIIFSLTPDPLGWGDEKRSTSGFLPQVSRRLIEVIPRLKNIRIRRIWRGLYPMTPDGIPIVDRVAEIPGLILSVGLCGQGLMLGPGLASNITSMILDGKPLISGEVFSEFSFYRSFSGKVEILK